MNLDSDLYTEKELHHFQLSELEVEQKMLSKKKWGIEHMIQRKGGSWTSVKQLIEKIGNDDFGDSLESIAEYLLNSKDTLSEDIKSLKDECKRIKLRAKVVNDETHKLKRDFSVLTHGVSSDELTKSAILS